MTLRVARIYFGLAWWATGRDRAWGLLLWALSVLLVAVPFLVAGVPHSGSITTTGYGTGRLMTDHYEQPGSRGWLSLGVAHLLLAAVGLVELTARLRRRRHPRRREPRLGAPLSPPAATGGPPPWVWGAAALGAVVLGWVDGSTGRRGPGGPARAADRGLPGLGGGTAGPVVG